MTTIAHPALYDHPLFDATLDAVAQQALACLPGAAARLAKAVAVVQAGQVSPDGADHTNDFTVDSQTRGDHTYQITANRCTCPDFAVHATATNGYACKHVLATWLYRRIAQRLPAAPFPLADGQEPTASDGTPGEDDSTFPAAQAPDDQALLAPYIVQLHGKAFVQYAGLLCLAHARGLQSLAVRLTQVNAELAIAEATALFADGRTFTNIGDASPHNVSPMVQPHFIRVAATRAAARALRDALNIGLCTVEELE